MVPVLSNALFYDHLNLTIKITTTKHYMRLRYSIYLFFLLKVEMNGSRYASLARIKTKKCNMWHSTSSEGYYENHISKIINRVKQLGYYYFQSHVRGNDRDNLRLRCLLAMYWEQCPISPVKYLDCFDTCFMPSMLREMGYFLKPFIRIDANWSL